MAETGWPIITIRPKKMSLISTQLNRGGFVFCVLFALMFFLYTEYILAILHVDILSRYYTRFFGRMVIFGRSGFYLIGRSVTFSAVQFSIFQPSGFGLLDQLTQKVAQMAPNRQINSLEKYFKLVLF